MTLIIETTRTGKSDHELLSSVPSTQRSLLFLNNRQRLFSLFLPLISRLTSYDLLISSTVMTSTSPTPPDISGLSISPQHVRNAHDSYDYDNLAVGSNPRQQYFATSPAVHSQVPYNPLGLNQSPLKNKSISRSGLPTVCHSSQLLFHPSLIHLSSILPTAMAR